ncbi:UBX domain-containing protein 4-like [Sinocyclocheilus grahami]|uniref:UBX domain-containing protein 4-like n=1 Tax=Sinocyclocheilus grahami TaxID=75366 RepID=UPI0007ACDABA|nr:PREDICTED: UBX domain-containing protein 4-like [Sinocyclocheilus grahami]
MRWFEGSIPAAIAAAKERRCVFVVVITGNDDQSAQLMSGWESVSVSEAAQNCCVAIRVDAQSEACVQFSQIYPVVCIPSSFFIGENGVPLEVIAGSVTEDELQRRISRVTQMHTQQIEGAEMNAEEADHGSASSKESLSVPLEEDRASGHVTPAEDEGLPSEDQAQDDKVERLTKKLEERREQKKKAEEEVQLKKEVERRKTGKEMLDFKKKQEEDKTKRLLEERSREKAEERAARERVKQQIALDRADRAARYAQSQQDSEATRLAALQAKRDAERDGAQRERSAVARIQFRLPDGSSFTNQFPSETRLLEARQFAAQEVGNRYGQFSLATMFPRREFTAEDLEKSLLELELTPGASIVLLPVRDTHTLTKKLEERREQKKKAEEEVQLKKEVERRKTGKEMLDFKKKQEEDKTKRLLEERSREKAEERAARERVKQQIALDRADRAARYAQSQQDSEATRLAALQAKRDAERDGAQRERSAVARIQFRLPDGSSFTNQFPSETRLLEARQFAAQEVGNRYGQFSLATMFPRREFTAEDLEKSLLELELTPGASIVLLPQSSRPSNTVVHSSAGGGVWAMLGSLLYPLLAVWRFISGFLFSSPPPPAAAQNQHTTNAYGSSAAAEPKRCVCDLTVISVTSP